MNLRWWGIVGGLFVSISGAYVSPAHAQQSLVFDGAPTGVPFEFVEPSAATVRLKACFTDVIIDQSITDASGLNCEGETWNGENWLSQHDAWSEFPVYKAENGQFHDVLAVKSEDPVRQFFYIIYVVDGKPSSSRKRVPANYKIERRSPTHTLRVSAYNNNEVAQPWGWIVANSSRSIRYIPVLQGLAIVKTDESEMTLSYRTKESTNAFYVTPFKFDQPGSYRVKLNEPTYRNYDPEIESPLVVRPAQKNTFTLHTKNPYSGTVTWLLDGVPQTSSRGATFLVTFARSGSHRVAARLDINDQEVVTEVEAVSYPHIRLGTVVPRPDGGDKESVDIHNTGDESMALSGWLIRRQGTTRTVKLGQFVAAKEKVSVAATNFFVNSGGTYELINESGQVVDFVSYPAVEEATSLVREASAIVWAIQTPPVFEESINVSGTIIRRTATTLRLDSPELGDVRLRIVGANLPSLHAGDAIHLTNVLKQTSRGVVTFIITGFTRFTIIPKTKPRPKKKSSSPVSVPIARALATPKKNTAITQGRGPPSRTTTFTTPSSNAWPQVLVALLFSLGVCLLLPVSPRKPL